MTALAPDTSAPTPTLVSTPMAERAARPKPTAAGIAAAVGGFAISFIGHSAFLVWGIGLWDMATPLSAAPPPSVMVDLVDDPWKSRQAPDPGIGGQPPAPPPAPSEATPEAATESPMQSAMASKPDLAAPSSAPEQPPAMPYELPSLGELEPATVDPGTPTGLRIAQMLQVPVELEADVPNEGETGGGAAERATRLVTTLVDEFKERLRTCWTTPPEAVGDDRIKVLIRVGLRRDGNLAVEPTLVQAVATPAGPAVVKSAISAVKQCQPYAFLPAEHYKEWRVLDVAFSANGVL